jgi:hypothetical protein
MATRLNFSGGDRLAADIDCLQTEEATCLARQYENCFLTIEKLETAICARRTVPTYFDEGVMYHHDG